MAPLGMRRSDPGQGRSSITAFNNGTSRNSISQDGTPVLPEVIAEAVSRGLLVGGGTYRLRHGLLVREGRA